MKKYIYSYMEKNINDFEKFLKKILGNSYQLLAFRNHSY